MGQHDIGAEFLRLTRHAFLAASAQQRSEPAPPLTAALCAPEARRIPLPAADESAASAADFWSLVNQRTSVREYTAESLSSGELSYLLWCCQGVKKTIDQSATLRTVPSAGARHALETVLLVNRVAELPPGLYQYLALEHALAAQSHDRGLRRAICRACFEQDFVAECAVFFVWLAVPQRMTWRYGERGYRYLFLDAGHACQNLYLAAESIGCGCCAVAAYDDEELNRLLAVDGKEILVIYAAAVGKKRKTRGMT